MRGQVPVLKAERFGREGKEGISAGRARWCTMVGVTVQSCSLLLVQAAPRVMAQGIAKLFVSFLNGEALLTWDVNP